MNRQQEYAALQAQLEQMPAALEDTLARAENRLARRNRRIWRSMSSFAASFALFVALVNFCMPVAYACSQVPVLRELAEAVTFSKSLTRAVDNEYVQPIDLIQTQNDITAKVEYLIVDQKQMTVFYRFLSEEYSYLDAETRYYEVGTTEHVGSFWGPNDHHVEMGKLQSSTVELSSGKLPDRMDLTLWVYDPSAPMDTESAPEEGIWADHDVYRHHLAEFCFTLDLEPYFTAQAETYPLDQTIEIDGQRLILTKMEIYPTHMRLYTKNHPENTAKITGLEYEIRGDWGIVFEPEDNGIHSFGTLEQDEVVYRVDSPWFCRSDKLELAISRATIEDKDMGRLWVDLTNGTTEGRMPQGVELLSVEKQDGGVVISYKAPRIRPNHSYQCFRWTYYDAEDTEYRLHGYSSGGKLDEAESENWFSGSLYLRDYPHDEVWLVPLFSHYWSSADPLVVTLR